MHQIDWADLPADITEGFNRFHADNPQVFTRLVEMTRTVSGSGRKRIGMKMLFEVLRWEYFLATDSDEPFKLNNNYTAFYVRLIEQNHPELRGIFSKRRSVSDQD